MRAVASQLLQEGRTQEAIEALLEALEELVRSNAELRLLLSKVRAASRGATSERVSAEQLSLLSLLMGSVEAAEAEPDPEEEARQDAALDAEIKEAAEAEPVESDVEPEAASGPQARGAAVRAAARRRNRWLEQMVPRVVIEHDVPPEKAGWERIGTEEQVRLRYQAAHFYKELHRVPVMRSPELNAEGGTEIVACDEGVPPTLSPRSLAAADVVAWLLVQKYERHLPLHRLHRSVLADEGIDLPVSTLADWAAMGGEACLRVRPLIQQRLLKRWLVRTDATGLRVLDASGVTRGTFWCYVGQTRDGDEPPDILFLYTPTGEGETGPWEVLRGREGYVQADALNIYDRVFNGRAAQAVEVGCLAHARRRFMKLLPEDMRAAYVVQLIRRIYRLETLADHQRLSADARTEYRRQRTLPVLHDKLLPYLQRIRETDVPGSPIVEAATYMTNHWAALTRFAEDGGLPLDNNFVESQLRPIRLGENNYLFAGSHEAADRTAAILTMLANCRAHGLNSAAYLEAMLNRLARPIARQELERWTPAGWAASQRTA
jgi:hypothetical protein